MDDYAVEKGAPSADAEKDTVLQHEHADGAADLEAHFAQNPPFHECMLRVLRLCEEQQPREAVEEAVAAMPEMRHATRSPSMLVRGLVKHGGLDEWVEVGDCRMTPAEFEAMLARDAESDVSEFELDRASGDNLGTPDDAIVDADSEAYYDPVFFLITTPEGRAMAAKRSTGNRLAQTREQYPQLGPLFDAIIELCATPQSLSEITALIERTGFRTAPHKDGKPVVYPSFVLGLLQSAGAVVWDDGWRATNEEGGY